MRITAFILAMIILVLCCMPCADLYSQSCVPVKENSHKAPQSQHQDHEDSDLCSPFCYCSCCSTVAVTPHLTMATFTMNINTHESVYCEYHPAVEIGIHIAIWQPPKA